MAQVGHGAIAGQWPKLAKAPRPADGARQAKGLPLADGSKRPENAGAVSCSGVWAGGWPRTGSGAVASRWPMTAKAPLLADCPRLAKELLLADSWELAGRGGAANGIGLC
jgi:hypothetical protein